MPISKKGPVKMRFVVEIDTETISLLTLRFPHLNLFHLCTTFVTVFTFLLSERKADEAWKPCNKSILFQKSIELKEKRLPVITVSYCTYREWCWIQFIKPILHELKCKHNRYTILYTYRHFYSAIISVETCRGFCVCCVHILVHIRLVL
jgi:hypothetical protein